MSNGAVTGSDNAVGWAILLVILLVIGYLIWYFFEFEIKSGIRWVRWAEMWVISWVLPQDYEVVDLQGRSWNFHKMLEFIPQIPYTRLSDETMTLINTVALTPLKWVYGSLLAGFGFWALFDGPETTHRRILNLDGLINAQSKNFPVIKPFVKFNPADQPVRPPGSPVPAVLPLFSEALGPEEWLAYNHIPIPDGKIDEQVAYDAFAKQLGAPWAGVHKLPPYKKALVAAFCLKAVRKRVESDALLADIAECWDHEKGLQLSSSVMAKVNAILRNKDNTKLALGNANRHAFQTTAIMRVLQTAREQGGVLAPAQFVWLRGYDRSLWYPLNNLGRHTFHMEALGAICHFREERITDRPIPKPKLKSALDAIIKYMGSQSARPVPQLDYSHSEAPKQTRTKQMQIAKGETSKKAPASKGIKKPKGPSSSGIKKPKAPVRKQTKV